MTDGGCLAMSLLLWILTISYPFPDIFEVTSKSNPPFISTQPTSFKTRSPLVRSNKEVRLVITTFFYGRSATKQVQNFKVVMNNQNDYFSK